MFRAATHNMQSSPLPPLPAGNTPLIPTKHDTPRPISRDSMAETPVVPPITALSPSPALFFTNNTNGNKTGMPTSSHEGGIEGVETDLGVGSVPVKKMVPLPPVPENGQEITMAQNAGE
jgi:hypothetical protein